MKPLLCATLTLLILALLGAGCECGRAGAPGTGDEDSRSVIRFTVSKPGVDYNLQQVSTTNAFATEWVKNLGEGVVRVFPIVRAGLDPHDFRPAVEHSNAIRDSVLVFAAGHGFETRMVELIDLAGFRAVFLAENPSIKWIDHEAPNPNPHVWWSVPNAITSVNQVREELAKFSPENAEKIGERAGAVVAQLEELDRQSRAALALIPADKRVIITPHDAFPSFGREYGFETIGVLGVQTREPLKDGRLEELTDLVGRRKIPALFLESACGEEINTHVRRIALMVNEKYGFEPKVVGSVFTDTFSAPGVKTSDYIGAFKANVIQFVTGLSSAKPADYFYQ